MASSFVRDIAGRSLQRPRPALDAMLYRTHGAGCVAMVHCEALPKRGSE